ncbi:MAG: metallophosphoesterase [Clostridiales bacterium]|jgi:predicted MPP superfamily phosphohydrolase|nr:metallophosphoesterase [Clostridiales bacterium]
MEKVFKIIAMPLCVLIVAGLICLIVGAVGNNANMKFAKSIPAVEIADRLTPEIDAETGYTTFTTDRDFKILQLTDTHLGGGFLSLKKDAWAINAIADLVTYTKPDLVIVTGDMVYPMPFSSGTVDNMPSTKIFAQTMESLGVYWTVVFGNHDTEAYSFYDRKKISDFYENDDLKYCVYTAGPDEISGYGNQIINVENSNGIITQSLVLLDSHAYVRGFVSEYDNVHQDQVDWYEKEILRLDGINKNRGAAERLKSLAFFHIPLTEQKDAWLEYVDNGEKNTDNVKYVYGSAWETGKIVYCGVGEDELFETMLKIGSTQGVFTGHDHLNNFSIYYNGGAGDRYIRLTYGMSIDYLAYPGIYKQTAQRGGTVILTSADGSFDCYGLRMVDHAII